MFSRNDDHSSLETKRVQNNDQNIIGTMNEQKKLLF